MKKLNHSKRTGILLLLLLIAGIMISAKAQTDQNRGTYMELIMHSTSLENNFLGDSPDRYVSVYLPPGYHSSPEKRYPVIYFLHSYDVDHTAFFGGSPWYTVNFKTICDKLITAGEIEPVIVVSPNSYNKYWGSFYTNSIATGNWADFIVKDVVHFIDNNFRTIPQKESRGLAGHSMGGTGTFWLVMNYPDVFNAAYMQSGFTCHDDGNMEFVKEKVTEAVNAQGLENLGWTTVMYIAGAASYTPDTLAPPFYAQFPYDASGILIDSIWQEWLKYDLLNLLPSFKDSLLQLKAIKFEAGIDEDPELINGNRKFSEKLTELNVPHVFEEFEGDHTNKLTERIETKLLPFFSANLSDTMVSGTIHPKLILWQEIETKENYKLNKTIYLDTIYWNRNSVTYKIIAGDRENLFSIDSMHHTIVADTMMLDYEAKKYHILLIEATSKNGMEQLIDTANVFIRIENIYDSPTTLFDATFEIEENSETNLVVGSVPRENMENVSLSFRIIAGNINRTFKINGSLGIIQVSNNDSLDYESYKQFVLQVAMVETSGIRRRDTATITINILNDPADDPSILENNNLPDFEIFPNPVRDIVNIKTQNLGRSYFSITSLTGKLIYSRELEGTETQIDFSSFPKGIYFIAIRSKEFVTTRKIVKY